MTEFEQQIIDRLDELERNIKAEIRLYLGSRVPEQKFEDYLEDAVINPEER